MALPQIIPVPPRVKDLTGLQFGRLCVLGYIGSHLRPSGRKRPMYLCICACGQHSQLQGQTLSDGMAKSCGCLQKEVASGTAKRMRSEGKFQVGGKPRHGLSHTSIHNIWSGIRERTRNPNCRGYARYGARGIGMCDRWYDSFEAFLEDMGPRPDGKSIDRIDNDKGYSPDNCRWATREQQAQNTRATHHVEYNGETVALAEAARRSGVSQKTLRERVLRGRTGDDLFVPVE